MADYDDRSSAYRDTTTTSTTTPYRDTTTGTTGATAYRDSAADDRDTHRHQHHQSNVGSKNVLDWLAIILLIVGGLNWGLVGLFGFDLVAAIFGSGTAISRAIYIAVGVAAIWGFALMRLSPANRH
jgi:uncharacterized membrane protein YuzA (DUF378 family)